MVLFASLLVGLGWLTTASTNRHFLELDKINNYAKHTFWYVMPTLPMFLAFPWLYGKLGFWGAIGASVVLTVVCFFVVALIARAWDIDLML